MMASIASFAIRNRVSGHLVSPITTQTSQTENHLATTDISALPFVDVPVDKDKGFDVMTKDHEWMPCCVCRTRLYPDIQDVPLCTACGGIICCPGCGWRIWTDREYRFFCFHCADYDHSRCRSRYCARRWKPISHDISTFTADGFRDAGC